VKFRTRKKAFVLTETLVALLLSATVLSGAILMALQGSHLLSHLDKRNGTFVGIEAGLAVLRADLNNALTFNGRNVSPQEEEEKTTLEIKLERFVVNPANGQMILARIGWHLGSGGIKREISTLDDRSWSAHQFSNTPLSSSLTYLGADLWKLDLTLTEELPVKAFTTILSIDTNEAG
jgi:type II secretory pathway component PulJ